MTNKFKFLSILAIMLIVPLCVLGVGCVGSTKHEASTKYNHDANFHWNTCVCEKADCEEKYNIEAHTWVDGTPTNTETETTTPQMCNKCGATNNKITRTDAQVKALFVKLCDDYFTGNRSFTFSMANALISYNSSTQESVTISTMDGFGSKVVKEINNYKEYDKETRTFKVVGNSSNIIAYLQQYDVLLTFKNLKDVVNANTITVETNDGVYTISLNNGAQDFTFEFNTERIVSFSQGNIVYTIVDTFDQAAFNAFDTTGYTLATN